MLLSTALMISSLEGNTAWLALPKGIKQSSAVSADIAGGLFMLSSIDEMMCSDKEPVLRHEMSVCLLAWI